MAGETARVRPAPELRARRQRRHPADRTGEVVPIRPPAWEWSFLEDGALALAQYELAAEGGAEPDEGLSQSRRPVPLKDRRTSATVPRMPPRRASRQAALARRRSAVRARRFALLTIVGSVLLVTLVLTAFGAGSAQPLAQRSVPLAGLVPDGPPVPQIVAVKGPLRLQLPVSQSQVTAVGYHAAGNGAIALEPLGEKGNRGLLGRLLDRLFGSGNADLTYYQLPGGAGPSTSSLDVGAAPGIDAYSPVDGTVIAITDFVLNRKAYGVRVDLQPTSAPSLVVSVTRLRPDPSLTVGATVTAGTSRIGTILDLSKVERHALARYTQDAGNHVSIEVHPAATLSLP